MKQYSVIVPGNLPKMRISQFIRHALPLIPTRVVRDAFKKHDVKQDGTKVSADEFIKSGAVISIFTTFDATIDIVYEDNHILIINKPAGISVEDDGRGGQTVVSWAEERSGSRYKPLLCHRLDNQTTGLLIIAKTSEAESVLNDAIKNRNILKEYTCLVKGTPVPEHAILKAYLNKDPVRSTVRVLGEPIRNTKPIITEYHVIEKGDIARVQINLITGRTHQIRAHMAFIGHPVLGDDKYGDRLFNKVNNVGHLKLCASKLTFRVDGCLSYLNGRCFSIQAPF